MLPYVYCIYIYIYVYIFYILFLSRFVSSVIIETGIKLSPRALENRRSQWQTPPDKLKSRYSDFEADLCQENTTSTPNRKLTHGKNPRKSPEKSATAGMTRSTVMFDLHAAASSNVTPLAERNSSEANSPVAADPLYLTDLRYIKKITLFFLS